jgi:drug/metabolite transporter (DMT)-like permease
MLRVTAPLATIEVASSVRQSAVLRIALLALFWGSSFLWIKLAVPGLSPAEVTLGRLVLGAGVLFAIVAAPGGRLRRDRAHLHAWRSASGFGSVGAIESLAAAASYGIAYVYMDRYLLPVVSIVLGVLVLGEQVTIPVMAGIAPALAGVALTRARPARAAPPRPR